MALKFEALKKVFRFPFHSLLLAVFPILSLYAYNIFELLPSSLVRPLVVSLLGTLVIFGILSLVFRNLKKAAIVSSIFVGGFFSYGHFHNWLASFFVESLQLYIGGGIFLAWILTLVVVSLLLFKTERDLSRVTGFLNFAALALVLVTAVNILQFEIFTKEVSRRESSEIKTSLPPAAEKPDIYYLIFDRYAGEKVLRDFYGFDNRDFTNFLKKEGFYVADRAAANYPMTLLSLTSSLNLDYLTTLFDQLPTKSVETPAYALLEDSAALRFLRSLNYRYYHLGSWYYPTRFNPHADENFNFMNLAYKTAAFDSFEFELYRQTVLPPFFRKLVQWGVNLFLSIIDIKGTPDNLNELHYRSALYQVETLKEVRQKAGPKFVFAHILLPHAPIVFGKDCEYLSEGATGEAIKAYLNQLACTNRLIEEIVKAIKSQSENAVIILQADEGANPPLKFPYEGLNGSYGYGFEGAPTGTLVERFNILTAIYLGGSDTSALYSNITPANLFRVVFNSVLGTDLPLLPDKNFASWDHLWDFHEVTDTLRK